MARNLRSFSYTLIGVMFRFEQITRLNSRSDVVTGFATGHQVSLILRLFWVALSYTPCLFISVKLSSKFYDYLLFKDEQLNKQ